jgi:hypothetical protein
VADEELYLMTVQIGVAGFETEFGLGFVQDGGTNGPDTMEATCQAWEAAVLPTLLLALSGGCRVHRIAMKPITNTNEVPGVVDLTGEDGAVLGDALPASMCAIIHMATVAPNAKHNGRLFISGVSEEAQVEGTLTGAQLTLMQNLADKLAIDVEPSAPETATFVPAVISRFVDGAKRTPPVGFLVTIPVAKADLRQQRLRKTPAFGFR